MPAVYVSDPKITIDGQPASEDLHNDILQLVVEESLHLPSMLILTMNNPLAPGNSQQAPWHHASSLTIGKTIKLEFTSATTASAEFDEATTSTIFEGEITGVETHFTQGSQAPLIIRAYDKAHRLTRGRYSRSFQNKTDDDIVKQIAGEASITVGTVDAAGGPYGYGDIGSSNGYTFQNNQTNLEFLHQLAARNGFECFIQDNKLNFRKPASSATLTLKLFQELQSFSVRVTSAEQVSQVEVRGWNYQSKQAISALANSGKSLTQNVLGEGTSVNTKFNLTPKLIVTDRPVSVVDEATKLAQALWYETADQFVIADARADGNPLIRPGKCVAISGSGTVSMGDYAGTYYITETRHIYAERLYTTEFSVRGLRGEDLLSVIAPSANQFPTQTPLVGIVTDNNDPKGWGRVRVKFPTLTEEHTSYWARVVGVGIGASRGLDCLPEVNDEVVVIFESGDIHRPYVLGGVWNGTDAPKEPVAETIVGGKVRLRTFTTRTGHQLQFVEEDKGTSKKGVYLKTVYGHEIRANDTEKSVQVKTSGGHEVTLDDTGKSITVKTTGNQLIKMEDTSNKITISAQGTVEIKANTNIKLMVGPSSIELTSANINIQSPAVKVSATGSASLTAAGSATVQGASVSVQGAIVRIN